MTLLHFIKKNIQRATLQWLSFFNHKKKTFLFQWKVCKTIGYDCSLVKIWCAKLYKVSFEN